MSRFIGQILQGRFLGHPIHAMFVHFPAALFPVSFILDLLSFLNRSELFAASAWYATVGGVAGGLAAALFGTVDYVHIPAAHPAWKTASLHGLLNAVWLGAFGLKAALVIPTYPFIPTPSGASVTTTGCLIIGILVSNFLGGQVLFKYRVGLPEEQG